MRRAALSLGICRLGVRAFAWFVPSSARQRWQQEWDAELRGRKLTHMESYYSPSAVEGGISGGYSQNIDMALCSDGTFYYDDASVVSAGNTGINALGQGGSGARGQWSIAAQGEDAILEMRANSGETWSYTITWQDKLVHLNDRKFFRVENDWCS